MNCRILVNLLLFAALWAPASPSAAQTPTGEPTDSPVETIAPESLPELGEKPVVPSDSRTFVGNRSYEFTYRSAHWDLEINDGNGRVRLRWGETGTTLDVSIDIPEASAAGPKKPTVPTARPASGQTSLGGAAATEVAGWQDSDDPRLATYNDTLQCARKGKLVVVTLNVPQKDRATAPPALQDVREIQSSWVWHF